MIGINHILVDQKHHLHGGKKTATEAQVDQDMKKEQDRKAGAERKKTQKRCLKISEVLRQVFLLGMYIGIIHHIVCNCVF